jgi:SNF2 family DNA or RNA helicase
LLQSDPFPRKPLFERLLKTALSKTKEKENFHVIRSSPTWKHFTKSLPRQGVWISSINGLPKVGRGKLTELRFQKNQRGRVFPTNAFDWIIADEAHVIRTGHFQKDETESSLSKSAVKKLYAVVNENTNAKLLLLTATPFQNNVNEMKRVIDFLQSSRQFRDGYSIVDIIQDGLNGFGRKMAELTENPEALSSGYSSDLMKGLDKDVSLLIGAEDGREFRRPKIIRGNKRQSGLDDFLRDVVIRNNKPPLKIEMVGALLTEAEKMQYLFYRDMATPKKEDKRTMMSVRLSQLVSSKSAFRKRHPGRFDQIKEMLGDTLFQKKSDVLRAIIEGHKEEKRVLTVFCRFIPTLEELEKDCQDLLSTGLIEGVKKLYGGIKQSERKGILVELEKANKKAKKPIVFLVSQVGNEGLDFDTFCNTVVHFDGHYNPAIIDQRNGRVYRGENTNPKNIKIKRIFLEQTYDQRISHIELEKRKMKDFYLGDGTLERIFESILEEGIDLKREHLEKLLKFRINLSPKYAWLLPAVKRTYFK